MKNPYYIMAVLSQLVVENIKARRFNLVDKNIEALEWLVDKI